MQFAMEVVVRIESVFGVEYLRRGNLMEEAGEGGIAGQEGFGWMVIVFVVAAVVVVVIDVDVDVVVEAAVFQFAGIGIRGIDAAGTGINGVVFIAVVTRLDVVSVVKFFVVDFLAIVFDHFSACDVSVVGDVGKIGWEDWEYL